MAEDKKIGSQIKKDADGTITLSITIPWANVKKTWDEEIDHQVKHATLPGFREGKAPKEMVEKKLDQEKIREEVLKKILPNAYLDAVKEYKINPIINPKIHVEKLENEKDWTFNAITCEVPEIKLNDYKSAIKAITAKSKIVIPGKTNPEPNFDEIVGAMLSKIEAKIPGILTEGEVDRLLSQLLDEVKRLGLSLDQYLASSGKTVEQLRQDYSTKAQNDIKLEFALQKIADEEKITVSQKEIDEALQKAKDETERKQLESNVYLLANIIRQQKTLDFIKSL
jgi:FKBP-type peptidyl-prolyl cis-trans isomerase (trigger factor)